MVIPFRLSLLLLHAMQLIGCDGPALTSEDEKVFRMDKGLSREEADDLGCDVSAFSSTTVASRLTPGG